MLRVERFVEPCGDVPPAELEGVYYRQNTGRKAA